MKRKKIAHIIDSWVKICFRDAPEAIDYPADKEKETLFLWSKEQLQESRWQMRINYTGEICAQALYSGHKNHHQSEEIQQWLEQAKVEEYAHLQWCSQRLNELGYTPSKADPFFYIASYGIARGLSCFSERYNIRFIRETERLVGQHLQSQLSSMSFDVRSCKIIQKMCDEELEHQEHAHQYDSVPMPKVFQKVMALGAQIMRYTVKYI